VVNLLGASTSVWFGVRRPSPLSEVFVCNDTGVDPVEVSGGHGQTTAAVSADFVAGLVATIQQQAEEIGALRERTRMLEAAVQDRDRAMQGAAWQDAEDDGDRERFGSQESDHHPGYATQFQDATDAIDEVLTAQER